MESIKSYVTSYNRTQYEDIEGDFSGIGPVKARYIPSLDIMYRGKRLIEALPPVRSWEQSQLDFEKRPYWTADMRMESVMTRYNMVEHVSEFRISRKFTSEIDIELYSALIRCYKQRVPNNVPGGDFEYNGFYRTTKKTVPGVLILGDSGTGKTTAVMHALSYIPQMIVHEMDNSRMIQIPYINVVCPPDGSIKNFFDLCIAEFERITGLKISCFDKRMTADEKSKQFRKLAMRFNLGMVIVDEIQNLLVTKKQIILNHFLVLANELSIPFVFVGTNAVVPYLKDSPFFIQRRMGREIHVDRFEQDAVWEDFMRELWRFQWTREEIPLTREFSNLFYRESGGIIDRAVELFQIVQKKAIKMGMDTAASLTPAFVLSISGRDYSLSQEGLNTLADEGPDSLRRMPSDLRQTHMQRRLGQSFFDEKEAIDVIKNNPNSKLEQLKCNVIENVSSFSQGQYTLKQIERAFIKIQGEIDGSAMDEHKLSMEVLKCLLSSEPVENKSQKVKQSTAKKNRAIVTREELPIFRGIGASS